VSELFDKALQASRSARLLYEAGDYNGCVNRAYYAMFDVARAYLKLRHGITVDQVKTHSGLLSSFSKLAIQKDGHDAELGRLFNRAMTRRTTADYDTRSVEAEAAETTLRQMEAFIAFFAQFFEEAGGKRT